MIAAQLVWEHAISHFLTYFSPDYVIAVCGQPWLRDLDKDMILTEKSGVELHGKGPHREVCVCLRDKQRWKERDREAVIETWRYVGFKPTIENSSI